MKQEKTSRNTETNSKINFIFGARKIIFRFRLQTDFIRLVSSELVLRGGAPDVQDGCVDRFVEKTYAFLRFFFVFLRFSRPRGHKTRKN